MFIYSNTLLVSSREKGQRMFLISLASEGWRPWFFRGLCVWQVKDQGALIHGGWSIDMRLRGRKGKEASLVCSDKPNRKSWCLIQSLKTAPKPFINQSHLQRPAVACFLCYLRKEISRRHSDMSLSFNPHPPTLVIEDDERSKISGGCDWWPCLIVFLLLEDF